MSGPLPGEIRTSFANTNDEIAEVLRLCSVLSGLDDGQFVVAVRNIEYANPKWLNYTVWLGFVRRELDLRMLLK